MAFAASVVEREKKDGWNSKRRLFIEAAESKKWNAL